MRKKPKPIFAYAAIGPDRHLNPYWIRAEARQVRHGGPRPWHAIRKDGWRIVRVKVTAAGVPR